MSAPDTNTEKQAKKHRGPLTGMAMMVLWAAVLLVGLVIFLAVRGGTPEGAAEQVNDQTGEVEENEGAEGAPATDDASQATGGTDGADPAAVTVPSQTVTAPQTGAGSVPDTDPGESQAAEPLAPVDEEGAEGGTDEEAQPEPAGN